MATSKLIVKLKSDTGSSTTDLITKTGTLAVSGAATGDTVVYRYLKLDGSWSAWQVTTGTIPAPTGNGTWTCEVKEVNKSGALVATTSITFTLDTIALAPTVALQVDSGLNAGDNISNVGTLKIGAEAGAKIEYSINGGKTWTTTFTAVEGVNNVSVRQTDKAGNVSAAQKVTFTLDTKAGTAPTVALVSDSTDGQAGHASDGITSNATLKVGGLETGASAQYSIDGTNWSATFTAKEGSNTVWVRQLDVAGNASAATQLKFTLDTTAAVPGVDLMADSGMALDHITNQAGINVSGIEAGATVQYSQDGVNWSSNAPLAAEGLNSVLVRQVDTAGNISAATTLTYTLDTQGPLAGGDALSTASDLPLAFQGSDLLLNDIDATSLISLLGVDGTSANGGSIVDNLDGSYTYQAAANFTGTDTFTYQLVDAAGNASTGVVTVTVDAPAGGGGGTGNQAPVVYLDTIAQVTADSTTPLLIDALLNAYDPEGSALSVVLNGTGLPTGVSFDVTSQMFSFDASFWKAGDAVTFTYGVSDGSLVSQASATVYVTGASPFTVFDAQANANTDLTTALLAANSGIVIDAETIAFKQSGAGASNFYDGSLTPLGIGAGLLLTSGTTPGTINTVQWFGTDNGGTFDPYTGQYLVDNGDADLNAVVNRVFSTTSYDATTLSFDFEVADPTSTSVSFNVVFGSDEYPEWVDQFVDCAIVLVNGQNVALFNHDLNSPLSVIGSNLSAGYFQDNSNGSLPIECDGVSKVLTIVAPVHAGTNTIKIGIGDTGDHIYDSGIFLANFKAGNWAGSGVLIEDNSATSGNDTLGGSTASDLANLGGGDDSYSAGAGDDIIDGSAGNDTITGGQGADTLTGGVGADDFDYSNLGDWAAYDSGADTITDFLGNLQALVNAPNLDAIDGDVLVFDQAALATLAGADWVAALNLQPGTSTTITADLLSANTDGSADQNHAQFVYDSASGMVGFDVDGMGAAAALAITLLGNHPFELSTTNFVIMA